MNAKKGLQGQKLQLWFVKRMDQVAAQKSCRECGETFSITEADRSFYRKMEVPDPALCSLCRQQRRGIAINHIYLFKRTCDGTGQTIISNVPPESKVKVYDQAFWYSDAVDNTRLGRPFDFTRPFFDQFAELTSEVPRPALFTDYLRDENSAYTNYAGRNKSCYLIFDSDENRDCYYSYSANNCRNVCDSYRIGHCELCYEAIDSRKCYNSAFLINCEGCHESMLLSNCIGCKNCILCCNLRQKQYYVFNEPVSKEKYESIRAGLAAFSTLEELRQTFAQFQLTFPQKYMKGFQNENCVGNFLVNCKNATHCFDCRDLWDGKYCYQSFMKCKDCMDTQEVGEAELIYECSNLGYNAYNCRFSMNCLSQLTNLTYCEMCFNGCADLFGCVGLKRKHHCILNKEYQPAEYKELADKIIHYMRSTGEWGEYFPAKLSPIPYNLSKASEFHPLTKDQALAKGFSWRDADEKEYRPQKYEIPDRITEVPDLVVKEMLACRKCRKNYKVIPQELELYRRLGLPVPRWCFECRHQARLNSRPPRRLWQRSCGNCGTGFETAYAPDRPEIVYCEKCYLEALD